MTRRVIFWLLLLLVPQAQGAEAEYSRQLMRDQASLFILANQGDVPALMPLMQSFDTDETALERDFNTLRAAWASLGLTAENSPDLASISKLSLSQRLIALEPNPQYLAVTNQIRHLLWLAQSPWPALTLGGWLRPGDEHSQLPALAEKLYGFGDLAALPESSLRRYEGEVVEAVKSFQRRHGLKDDGIVGEKTLYWLNQGPRARARMLARDYLQQSAERRQLPASMVLVNIPAFELTLMDEGTPVLHSRVIVGKPSRKTPLMDSEISAVVVNPSWRVPKRLMRFDVLPKVRKDGHYLAKKGFIVWTRDGEALNETDEFYQKAAHGSFPYRLEQRPGPDNALGRFKLHFANDDNVYLHDTPDKHLFDKSMRALSSGCVRVEKIGELADWLARQRVADPRQWQATLNTPERTKWFTLKQRLPVRFVYWTSWIDSEGKAQFRDDIYGLIQDNQVVASHQP
ncbi:L,D-transpeptidase family protein [Shewanella khirikhana]|uniref:L,D-transpeptidase family protein n=1 Tax=Shewanella khirikhana TaxID=1965282 RepID=UPI0030D54C51